MSLINFPLSRFNYGAPVLLQNPVICNLSGVLYPLSSHLSVLFVALQSIIRTTSLIFPFHRIRKAPVIAFILFCLLWEVGIAVFPFIFGRQHRYYSSIMSCNFSLREVFDVGTFEYHMMLAAIGIMPILWPVIPIIFSCFASVFILVVRKDSVVGCKSKTAAAYKRSATITITIITVLYIVLNVPYWIFLTFFLFKFSETLKYLNKIDPHSLLYSFLNPISFLLNAGLNPVLYIIRMKKVRANAVWLIRRFRYGLVPSSQDSVEDRARANSRCAGRTSVVTALNGKRLSETKREYIPGNPVVGKRIRTSLSPPVNV